MTAQLLGIGASLLRLAVWLALLTAIFAPLERLFALRPKKLFRKDVGVDVAYYFLNGLAPALILSGPMSVVVHVAHHLIPGAVMTAIAGWPIWLRAGAAMVVGETGYYWAHRLSHEIPLLWRFHSIHHSAEEIDFLVSARAHPIDFAWTRLCMLSPLFALGLVNPMRFSDGLIPIIILVAGSLWGYFVHANVRWRFGALEWIVATPGFHHWHHTLGLECNCNYASMLPWIDRLFGTLHLPKTWPSRYGLPEKIGPSLLTQLIRPFRND